MVNPPDPWPVAPPPKREETRMAQIDRDLLMLAKDKLAPAASKLNNALKLMKSRKVSVFLVVEDGENEVDKTTVLKIPSTVLKDVSFEFSDFEKRGLMGMTFALPDMTSIDPRLPIQVMEISTLVNSPEDVKLTDLTGGLTEGEICGIKRVIRRRNPSVPSTNHQTEE